MYFIFDILFVMFYAAYRGTKFERNGILEGQASSVLGFSVCFPGGLFVNYLLAEHWEFYRKLLGEYLPLFVVFPVIYALVVYQLVTRRYMEEELPANVNKRLDMFSVPLARFLAFLFFLLFFGVTMTTCVYTMYAFAK